MKKMNTLPVKSTTSRKTLQKVLKKVSECTFFTFIPHVHLPISKLSRVVIAILPLLLFALPQVSLSHVGYVVEPAAMYSATGSDPLMLSRTISDPFNISLMLFTLIIMGVVAHFVVRSAVLLKGAQKMVKRVHRYHHIVAFMLRVSLAVALIGAGIHGVLLSPTLIDATKVFSLIQIGLGILFLLGFMILPAVFGSIGLYIAAISESSYLLGNLDFLALCIGVFVFHSAKPGIDDMLGTSLFPHIHTDRKLLGPIVRWGLGLSMIYLALFEKICNPHVAELVVSTYNLESVIPVSAGMWVLSTGLIELSIGILFCLGLYTRLCAVVSLIVLTSTFIFFKEDLYSHITLFGSSIILLIEGSGIWSLDERLRKIRPFRS